MATVQRGWTSGLHPSILEEGDFRKGRGERSDYAAVDADERDLIDSLNTRRASQIMVQFAREDHPFFMACGLRRPHLRRILPGKYVDMYPPERIEISGHPPTRRRGFRIRIRRVAGHARPVGHPRQRLWCCSGYPEDEKRKPVELFDYTTDPVGMA